ncbi:MAG TPA: glycerate kinase [Cerasibacillus sp.]|uniref:glycerate kinase n=1 Tax=Cerasibacillus sp. TaxID=2498711 RepID=UPI002F428E9A
MNIVIAPDSFKGSMTALAATAVMERAALDVFPNVKTVLKPMADGGEGTLDILIEATKSIKVPITCTGPLGNPIRTYYALSKDQKTAYIESANIAGLTLVPEEKRNPDNTTSFGIGEVIKDALERGCIEIIIALGGSATNDGGLGMLTALGLRAWDQDGKLLGPFGNDLLNVSRLSFDTFDKRVFKTKLKIVSDVINPLCGSNGASYIFGPQKGATNQQVKHYDRALKSFSELIQKWRSLNVRNVEGAGAAGGLGFSLLILGGDIVPGAEFVADVLQLEKAIKQADLVLTGEGKSDEQTLFGKAPGYVAKLANHYQVPVLLISGSLTGDLSQLQQMFTGCFSIMQKPMSLDEAMRHSRQLLYEQTKQLFCLLKNISK